MNLSWKPFFHEPFLKNVNEYDPKSLAILIYELFQENVIYTKLKYENSFRKTVL
jgi:hypothetical protein